MKSHLHPAGRFTVKRNVLNAKIQADSQEFSFLRQLKNVSYFSRRKSAREAGLMKVERNGGSWSLDSRRTSYTPLFGSSPPASL